MATSGLWHEAFVSVPHDLGDHVRITGAEVADFRNEWNKHSTTLPLQLLQKYDVLSVNVPSEREIMIEEIKRLGNELSQLRAEFEEFKKSRNRAPVITGAVARKSHDGYQPIGQAEPHGPPPNQGSGGKSIPFNALCHPPIGKRT